WSSPPPAGGGGGATSYLCRRRRPAGLVLWVRSGRSAAVRLDEPRVVGRDDRLHAVSCAELGEDAPDVRLDGRLPDEQLARDLGVRAPAGHEHEHLALALGELVEPRVELAARARVGQGGREVLEQAPRRGRRD